MNVLVDPHDRDHTAEKSVRDELTRVFDTCHGCRQCVDLCGVFPSLFDLIDGVVPPEAGRLTPDQQDTVLAQCVLCHHCAAACPYAPERHESAVDVPRAVQRFRAMRHATGQVGWRRRRFDRMLGRRRRWRLAVRAAGARANVRRRRVVARAFGTTVTRRLPQPGRRDTAALEQFSNDGAVTVVPGCITSSRSGDLVADACAAVASRGVTCSVGSVECCGASSLDAGDLPRFRDLARRTVAALRHVAPGGDIVVLEPGCAWVISQEYPRYLDDEVRDVSERVVEPASWLADHPMTAKSGDSAMPVPDGSTEAVYLPGGHTRRLTPELPVERMLMDAGVEVTPVYAAAGPESLAGLSFDQDRPAADHATRLSAAFQHRPAAAVMLSETHPDVSVVSDATGRDAVHPVQLLAMRASDVDERRS